MRKCHSSIVIKTINARAGLVSKLFHNKNLGYCAKEIVHTEFRKMLQVLAKNQSRIYNKVAAGNSEGIDVE